MLFFASLATVCFRRSLGTSMILPSIVSLDDYVELVRKTFIELCHAKILSQHDAVSQVM